MSHYQTLGVDRGATLEEIKAAFRDISWDLHPDRGGKEPERYARVTFAYSVLSDAARRKEYDAGQEVLSDPCGKCAGEGRTWKQKGFTARVHTPCAACGGTGRITRR